MRWAWRLFQREWRGQVLVLALLTLALAAAIGGAAAAYNLAPAAGNAEFGSASHSLELDEPDPRTLPADISAAEEWFGTIDVIGRRFVPVPGVFDPVEFRAQTPRGPYSAPILALTEGRYPTAAGEVAVTDGVARTFEVGIGASFGLDGAAWTVVGTVESPSDLNDEFAMVQPPHAGPAESVTILVGGSDDRLESFRAPSGASATAAGRPDNEEVVAAAGVLAAATVVLLLVALVAAAGFVVVAQRRLRQLGMLAAIGATGPNIRLVMLSNGAVIGAVAAIVGTTAALVAWLALVPSLETVVGHRIATFDVPWWLIGSGLLLAVVTATGAAWWPARAVARIPIVSALSGRPPRPEPANRSAAVAGLLVVVATGLLALAGDPRESWSNILLIVAGIVALIGGILFASPLAIRALAGLGARSPVAVRLALRDLARSGARSGAALAAISLALGIAATIVVTSTSALYATAAEGNLSERQLLIRVGEIPPRGDVAPIPDRSPAEVERLDALVDRIASPLDAAVIPLDVALTPELNDFEGLPAVVLAERVDVGDGSAHRSLTQLYVASADMLENYRLDLGALPPETEVLTVEAGELWFQPMRPERVRNVRRLVPGYSSLPGSFITPDALRRRGWDTGRAAWLVDTSAPITDEQFAEARDLAASAGVTIEARHDQANLAALRTGATAAGILLALGIMAMTVGLIRSEAAGDLRILATTGATRRIRRTLTAATAGGLALLGAMLGIGGAYLGLGAAFLGDLATLSPVPSLHLLLIALGLPLVAAAAGWLLAGNEPPSLARQPLE